MNSGQDKNTEERIKGQKIGFIGLGVMGKSMASNLMKAGYSISLYNRTKSKATELIDKGATWCESPAAVAETSDIVFTIVGYPEDVRQVYFGDNGILKSVSRGMILVDMTTSSPELAVEISESAHGKDAMSLDAPVSGGDVGAKNGTLSIMVGGDKEAFDSVLPVFEEMGKNIVYQGTAGKGQHTKMCNQIAIAAGMLGVCESMSYAQKAGLDPKTVLKSIESGAAGSWSLSNLAPRMLDDNFEPGFYVKHFIKDMNIASESAEAMDIDAKGLKLALDSYRQLASRGEEDSGTQALFKLYQD